MFGIVWQSVRDAYLTAIYGKGHFLPEYRSNSVHKSYIVVRQDNRNHVIEYFQGMDERSDGFIVAGMLNVASIRWVGTKEEAWPLQLSTAQALCNLFNELYQGALVDGIVTFTYYPQPLTQMEDW